MTSEWWTSDGYEGVIAMLDRIADNLDAHADLNADNDEAAYALRWAAGLVRCTLCRYDLCSAHRDLTKIRP